MQIGSLGAGEVALAFARYALKAGHEILLSNSRGPESLASTVAELGTGAKAVTPQEACAAPIVLLAVPWIRVESVLKTVPPWNGQILVDTTNHFLPSLELADLGNRISSEIVAELAPGARIVKALNNIYMSRFSEGPRVGRGRRVLFVSGDDSAAKRSVAELLEEFGFSTIDLGSLHEGGRAQQIGNGLAGPDLVEIVP